MLNIDESSKKPLYCTDGAYAFAKNCMDTESIVTLGTILLHPNNEIFSHENMISLRYSSEPSIFLKDKRYSLTLTQSFILKNMKREENGKKVGMWPRIALIYDIYSSLNGEAPELKGRLEDWLGKRQKYFKQQPASEAGETADLSESDE